MEELRNYSNVIVEDEGSGIVGRGLPTEALDRLYEYYVVEKERRVTALAKRAPGALPPDTLVTALVRHIKDHPEFKGRKVKTVVWLKNVKKWSNIDSNNDRRRTESRHRRRPQQHQRL